MHRRTFFGIVPGLARLGSGSGSAARTRHLILIVNGGGVRKKDYYEDPSLCPYTRQVAREGFVFEQDHCQEIASHEAAFAELVAGLPQDARVHFLDGVPALLQRRRPLLVVCRLTAHDAGHESYDKYLQAVRAIDAGIGRVFDCVKSHPDFSRNTAIVIRPEFGRDDELGADNRLHHSYGFYYTHRVASIFWGPDFNKGVDRKTVVRTADMAPTLARAVGVDAIHSRGRVMPGLFRI